MQCIPVILVNEQNLSNKAENLVNKAENPLNVAEHSPMEGEKLSEQIQNNYRLYAHQSESQAKSTDNREAITYETDAGETDLKIVEHTYFYYLFCYSSSWVAAFS